MADEALWRRVLAGDGSSYGELYSRHADRVYSHCVRRCGSSAEAEDLTAETFAETWRQRDRVRLHDDAGLLPWLLGVAANLLRRSYRSSMYDSRMVARLSFPQDVPDHAEELVQLDADDFNLRILREVLGDLGPADQEIIQWCVLEGLAPSAVAIITNTPAGTIRSRLTRALRRAKTAHAAAVSELYPTRKTVEPRHD